MFTDHIISYKPKF